MVKGWCNKVLVKGKGCKVFCLVKILLRFGKFWVMVLFIICKMVIGICFVFLKVNIVVFFIFIIWVLDFFFNSFFFFF